MEKSMKKSCEHNSTSRLMLPGVSVDAKNFRQQLVYQYLTAPTAQVSAYYLWRSHDMHPYQNDHFK